MLSKEGISSSFVFMTSLSFRSVNAGAREREPRRYC